MPQLILDAAGFGKINGYGNGFVFASFAPLREPLGAKHDGSRKDAKPN